MEPGTDPDASWSWDLGTGTWAHVMGAGKAASWGHREEASIEEGVGLDEQPLREGSREMWHSTEQGPS